MFYGESSLVFAQGLSWVFPTELCCNCGRPDGLGLVTQDTRLTRFWLDRGSEYTFQLALPFCAQCAASSRRRPPSFIKVLLLVILASFGALAVVMAVGFGFDLLPLLERAGAISISAGIAVVAIAYAMRNKAPGQSSFYQPVRVTRVRQDFFSIQVKSIRFLIKNRLYARRFEELNQAAIARRLVEVRS